MALRGFLLLSLAAVLLAALHLLPAAHGVAPSRPLAALLEASSGVKTKPGNVYAVGDLHGDLDLAIELFHKKEWASGCTRANAGGVDCKWIAQNTIVVLLGDYVDRGAWSKQMYIWLRNLHRQAENSKKEKNSALIPLKGNHEHMMLLGLWTYVSLQDDVLVDLADWQRQNGQRSRLFDADQEADAADQVGRWVRSLPFYVMIGNTVFAHGGVEGLDKLQAQLKNEITIQDHEKYPTVRSLYAIENSLKSLSSDRSGSPTWSRIFAEKAACHKLSKSLDELSEARTSLQTVESMPPSPVELRIDQRPLESMEDVPLEKHEAQRLHRMVVGHSRKCGNPFHYRCTEAETPMELYAMDVCTSRYFAYFGVSYSLQAFRRGGVIAGTRDVDAGGFLMPLRIECQALDAEKLHCLEKAGLSPLDSATVEKGHYVEQATRTIAACALTPPVSTQPLHGLIPPDIRAACLLNTQRALEAGFADEHKHDATTVCDHCVHAQEVHFAPAADSTIPHQIPLADEEVATFVRCIETELKK